MFYCRIIATEEVLGAAHSTMQDAAWIARYEEALGLAAGSVEMFESEDDPRPDSPRMETPSSPAIPPDPNGMLLGVFQVLGKDAARALAAKYPDFMAALTAATPNYDVMQGAVEDAHDAEDLTDEQHAAVVALYSTFHIPEAA